MEPTKFTTYTVRLPDGTTAELRLVRADDEGEMDVSAKFKKFCEDHEIVLSDPTSISDAVARFNSSKSAR